MSDSRGGAHASIRLCAFATVLFPFAAAATPPAPPNLSKLLDDAGAMGSALQDPYRSGYDDVIRELRQGLPDSAELKAMPGIDLPIAARAAAALEGLQRCQAALGPLSIAPSSGGGRTLAVPDPEMVYVMDSATPESVRAKAAEAFERRVRIFVSGSEQAKRDLGGKAGGPTIPGLYQGHRPNLVTAGDKPLIGSYSREWGSCAFGGIALARNAEKRWFKSADGTYAPEKLEGGKLYSHACSGTPVKGGQALVPARGEAVDRMMTEMARIAGEIKAGKLTQAEAYGTGGQSCLAIGEEIVQYRVATRKHRAGSEALTCSSSQQAQSGDESSTALGCVVAGMQQLIELEMVPLYAYCIWRAQAEKILETFDRNCVARRAPLGPLRALLASWFTPERAEAANVFQGTCGEGISNRGQTFGASPTRFTIRFKAVKTRNPAQTIRLGHEYRYEEPINGLTVIHDEDADYNVDTSSRTGFVWNIPARKALMLPGQGSQYYYPRPDITGGTQPWHKAELDEALKVALEGASFVDLCSHRCDQTRADTIEMAKIEPGNAEIAKQLDEGVSLATLRCRNARIEVQPTDLLAAGTGFGPTPGEKVGKDFKGPQLVEGAAIRAILDQVERKCTCSLAQNFEFDVRPDGPGAPRTRLAAMQQEARKLRGLGTGTVSQEEPVVDGGVTNSAVTAADSASKKVPYRSKGEGTSGDAGKDGGRRRAQGGAAGFGSGTSVGGGPLTTEPAAAAPSGSDALSADTGATYGSGGAGGAGGGGMPVDEEVLSGQQENADFGAALGDGVNPMGSADPDDYMIRIGLKDSLFKVVERRYRQKTPDFVLGRLR